MMPWVMLEQLRRIPSLTFQVAILPSVMVGDKAGMEKFCAASETGPFENASQTNQLSAGM